eukprot:CAMPEP_0171094910 /NCGR_PEP_ID=MMETSP0766_2-20121228/42838_1 /TAXON_ID=439317 /ORGANISM="Gambierdiscus australes, Strain CAWD 149" /LENGTH=51 /DNA_ID=CAMNT_0011553655 /DNA_START=23 /DNA_END=178 /DNA_ORIENTATION=+
MADGAVEVDQVQRGGNPQGENGPLLTAKANLYTVGAQLPHVTVCTEAPPRV